MMSALMSMLVILQLVCQLAAQKGPTKRPYQSMPGLASKIVSCHTSQKGTTEPSLSLWRVRIMGCIWVLALMTLLLWIVGIVWILLTLLLMSTVPALLGLLVVLAVRVVAAVVLALSTTALISFAWSKGSVEDTY